jgi:molybdate transport system substrate-binding protein
MKKFFVCLLIACTFRASQPAIAQDLSVAAASDLSSAMGELIAGFERTSGHTIRLSTGSSGNFFTQIQNGAPFDVFFSADADYPRQLKKAGLVEPGSLSIYAIGKIVLWVRNDSRLDVNRGWALLSDPHVKKISIANPLHAPYGRAAEAAMRNAGVYDQAENRLVLGENISQAAQFVDSGNADVGVIALSLAASAPMKDHGKWWPIPEDSYPRLEQAAIVLRSSKQKDVARAFLAYVLSADGRAILKRNGFSEPPGGTSQR